MADKEQSIEDLGTASQGRSQYAVMIPCEQEDFADFISGLLGKPQTLEKVYHGSFDITRHDVENTFHIVDQRVRQQNEASLIQFTVRIQYDDDSSVLLNSLQDFIHFTEIRPLVSVAAHLSWTYLIRFQDKRIPEKQQIEISLIAGHNSSIIHVEEDVHIVRAFPRFGRGFISTRISHTARTWGVDIDSLLSGHIKTLLRSESKLQRWIYQHSEGIGVSAAIVFFLLTMLGIYFTSNHFLGEQLARVERFLSAQEGNPEALSAKVNFLLEMAAKGTWPRFSFGLAVFVLATVILAIFLGIWVGTTADNRPSSFLLLSNKAQERKAKILQKARRRWLAFMASLITSIVAGIIGNAIFAAFLRDWIG